MSQIKDARFMSADSVGSQAIEDGSVSGADIKLANNEGLFGRNVANDGDVRVARVTTSDLVEIGPNGSSILVGGGAVDMNGNSIIGLQLQGGDTASRPATPQPYQMYFDTDLGIPIWFDANNWIDAAGNIV